MFVLETGVVETCVLALAPGTFVLETCEFALETREFALEIGEFES